MLSRMRAGASVDGVDLFVLVVVRDTTDEDTNGTTVIRTSRARQPH